jgi:hypothetical protein
MSMHEGTVKENLVLSAGDARAVRAHNRAARPAKIAIQFVWHFSRFRRSKIGERRDLCFQDWKDSELRFSNL